MEISIVNRTSHSLSCRQLMSDDVSLCHWTSHETRASYLRSFFTTSASPNSFVQLLSSLPQTEDTMVTVCREL
eukprot:scaffold894_cov153-Cylindrotheca_fusiformis.AAC.10